MRGGEGGSVEVSPAFFVLLGCCPLRAPTNKWMEEERRLSSCLHVRGLFG